MIVHSEVPLNAESPRAILARSDLTPNDGFYIRSHGPIPEHHSGAPWPIRVQGLVSREQELTLEELERDFEVVELVATLQCAGNRRADLLAVRDIPGEAPWGPGATGTARWQGVRLADVLAAAGIAPEAAYVEFEGADVCEEASPPQPFGGSIPRHKALAPEVLLAWAMNGEPLPRAHGGPLRALVPGYIGARSVKWLRAVRARAEPSENFFQTGAYRLLPADAAPEEAPQRGVALGAIAVNAEILSPEPGSTVPAGSVELTGYAFAGDDRRIVRVDVSTDGGRRWRQAELLAELSPWSARRWRTRVELRPGPHELVARAWDSAAATQPEDPAGLWNPKGYVNNAWSRVALTARR